MLVCLFVSIHDPVKGRQNYISIKLLIEIEAIPANMEITPASVAPTIHFKIRKSESILLNRFSYSAIALAASLALSFADPASKPHAVPQLSCSWLSTHLLTIPCLAFAPFSPASHSSLSTGFILSHSRSSSVNARLSGELPASRSSRLGVSSGAGSAGLVISSPAPYEFFHPFRAGKVYRQTRTPPESSR